MGLSRRLFSGLRNCQLTRHQSSMPRISKLYHPVSNMSREQRNEEITDLSSKSHLLMMANGLTQPSSKGSYYYMPLLMRALGKLEKLIDKLMSDIGAEEIDMPMLTPAHLWKKTGRWDLMGPELFKLKDRHDASYCLGPTYEEAVTKLMSNVHSLSEKQMPVLWYQMSKKFRDEMLPRRGLLRGREFIMKDLYSFDGTVDAAERTYDLVSETYEKLFDLLELPAVKVAAGTGNIGGTLSHEFHLLSDVGEDAVSICPRCDYKANQELGNETCPNCSTPFETRQAIEVGHTFLLGDKYSRVFDARFTEKDNKRSVLQMGCYGLGVSRLIAASIEILSSENEIRWPRLMAPYSVCIIPPKKGSREEAAATNLALYVHEEQKKLPGCENEFVLDDRTQHTIGWRIMEARKLGYPYILVFGRQAIQDVPQVELLKLEDESNTKLTICDLFRWIDETFVFPRARK